VSNNADVALHGHDFLEFTYIQKGSLIHCIDGNTQQLCEGDYFIVDYGARHKYKSIGGKELSVINLLFYPDFIDRSLDRLDDFERVVNSYLIRFKYRSLTASPAGIAFHDESCVVKNILDTLICEYQESDAGYLEYIRTLLTQILIITMRKISSKTDTQSKSDIIKEIADCIKRDYRQELRLSDFAKSYCYSLSHISKKFKEEMGVGFTKYLQIIRIEKACALLENQNLSIGEVAAKVGYDDIKFFNKTFKKTIGLSPRAFRKMSNF
jgi:AraC-like DNA-binding protein